MKNNIIIRQETPRDYDAVYKMVKELEGGFLNTISGTIDIE